METSSFLIPFNTDITAIPLPNTLLLSPDGTPDEIAMIAAEELQEYLLTQTDWKHNFGLSENDSLKAIGKMFGILVVSTASNEIGYLSAFSGKLAGGNHYDRFVPPIYDSLSPDGFLNQGMLELSELNARVKTLKSDSKPETQIEVAELKKKRKALSLSLQNKLFDHYFFINSACEVKSVWEIFDEVGRKFPPSGAGECAAPKLLQHAHQHQLKPLAMAEFWWGKTGKPLDMIHKQFYPACIDKCGPILAFMVD